ncbi:hypothetical protein D3C81_2208050 [compost metagenome]
MYSFDDIRMNDKIVSPSIAIMIEFFEVMKSTYPEALNFIDESDCEILQFYRKNTMRINFDN